MQDPNIVLDVYQKRGQEDQPLERVYRQMFNPEWFLRAYGKIYRNKGAMTEGSTEETVDGMSESVIHRMIDLLRSERYRFAPVRRVEIPKPNGKKRPLGLPTWSDKLVQEVLRTMLEAYYEPKFSPHSHGFRPQRGCHTALKEIRDTWKGAKWFVEGDIKGCFDNIDHDVLLEVIARDIHDGRILKLLSGLFKAGYVTHDWRYFDTLSGTPQGGIISPLLSNIYLGEFDRFVERTLIPAYPRGRKRRFHREYNRVASRRWRAKEKGDRKQFRKLELEMRSLSSKDPNDPNYRRLKTETRTFHGQNRDYSRPDGKSQISRT